MFNLDDPTQPLLMVGEELPLRQVTARERKRKRRRRAAARALADRKDLLEVVGRTRE